MKKRRIKKSVIAVLLMALILPQTLPAGADAAVSGGWKKNDGVWYYYMPDGDKVTGWKKVGGKWYYFSKDGVMQTGWRYISGKWYYLNPGGDMALNEYRDGFWLGKNGAWDTRYGRGRWKKNSKGQWYQDGKWYPRSRELKIDGKLYYFDSAGYLQENADSPEYGKGITKLSANVKQFDIPETAMSDSHSDALSEGGAVLLQKMTETDGQKNYLISPASIQMALGMTCTGADKGSATEKAIMAVLMPGVTADSTSFNKEMATFAGRLKAAEGVEWGVANSVWVKNDGKVKLRDSYITDVASYYKAELFAAPFDQGTIDAINGWVSRNTKEMIPQIIKELSEDARIALINALSFEGEWAVPYEESSISVNRDFTNADGTTSRVTMLSSKEYAAVHLAGGLGFIKPYNGNKYSFVGLLPPEGMTAEEYIKKLADGSESFSEAVRNPDVSRDVYVDMPEFKAEYMICMDDVLKSLGMEVAYTGGNPEFGRMVTDDSEQVGIGTIVHKAVIEVDRKGTRAAAATAVIIEKNTSVLDPVEPYYICLDRPFVYAITDNETGIPVFLGIENRIDGN